MTLADYVETLQAEHRMERVYSFQFEGKSYWLKQPEHPKGIQRLLKPFSRAAFKREIQRIKLLIFQKAPIPPVKIINSRCLVMEDAGRTVRSWLESDITDEQKQRILDDCAKTLANLHARNIVHGRPLLKDILWQNGKASFIDFEVASRSRKLAQQKTRDALLFIYGVCRERTTPAQIQRTINTFIHYEDSRVWHYALSLVKKHRILYYVLLPFKSLAKTDLLGFYVLFETLLTKFL
ncbi:hypothetical protein CBG46_03425 [Actinobacillus succinogenes]|uniref:Mn2+-dependent serine/threonine protein kinase n=1 Tax=Actinobacillus succinogenes (strain ATCC 55618 / DSM 22257 / CCUG 43843 / 130Z) TaxID=339671 RepID=A6VLB4_ACTSZ|nr:lipopolysaccharide kinase InaA family protein [Actinobacillus succinogenes]ABR73761.1 conserved hypothetical protein [Actinobacillus succinogenes 130Z]PHI39781.1 hypothetical protein CBG46_03425 [Actinobacillus succinogenes]